MWVETCKGGSQRFGRRDIFQTSQLQVTQGLKDKEEKGGQKLRNNSEAKQECIVTEETEIRQDSVVAKSDEQEECCTVTAFL